METRRPIAFVTGAAYGLGRTYAEELAQQNYDLVLVDLPSTPLNNVVKELQTTYGIRVQPLFADLSNPQEVQQIADHIDELPRLDLLINNAGFMISGRVDELTLDRMLKMTQLHTATVLQFSRVAIEKMRPVGKGGIINVSSIAGFSVARHYAAYNATKAFIQMFTRCLALELEGSGISILAVCPGPMHTNIFSAEDAPPLEETYQYSAIIWTPKETVVKGSLARLGKKVVWVPGWLNKLIVATSGINTKLLDRFT